jgi:asparagine synthase (glutamine-hydrolysing)
VASELKALEGYCTKIQLFPGHYMTSKMVSLYNGTKESGLIMMQKTTKQVYRLLKALEAAVHRQLMSSLWGFAFRRIRFFSYFGYSQKICSKRIESGDVADAWYPQLHFSVGLEGSPDLAAAQIVADHIEPSITKLNLHSRRFRCYP